MIQHEDLKATEIHALRERVGDLEQQRASASNEAPDPGEGTSDVDSSRRQRGRTKGVEREERENLCEYRFCTPMHWKIRKCNSERGRV